MRWTRPASARSTRRHCGPNTVTGDIECRHGAQRSKDGSQGEKMAEKTIMDMLANMGKQFNLPKVDYDALLETHRKNIEAVQRSALAFSQDGRALLARQQEIFADVMRQSRELIAEFKPPG